VRGSQSLVDLEERGERRVGDIIQCDGLSLMLLVTTLNGDLHYFYAVFLLFSSGSEGIGGER